MRCVYSKFHTDCSRNLGLSEVGQDCEVTSSDMNDETFTVTLLLTLDPTHPLPFTIDLCVDSNTQWNFLKFVCDALENKTLVEGDFLIVDNSSVHSGSDAFPLLIQVLEAAGVKYVSIISVGLFIFPSLLFKVDIPSKVFPRA